MINAEQAKAYIKPYTPPQELVDEVEKQIKNGNSHISVFTTRYLRSCAEDFAKYCREQGYRNARIEDIYSNSGVKGGNVLKIDLD